MTNKSTTTPKPSPKYRRPLNNYQIQLLQTLYKFRFATTHLIAKSQGSKYPRVILARLRVLVDQDYIGQNYDKSYKIKGKPATYYLRPNAVRYFKQQPYASPKVLKSIYQDKRANKDQIAHYLHVFSVYVEFKRLYPEEFKFFSKSELAERKGMPERMPDAYLHRTVTSHTQANDYFLDSYEEATYYLVIQRKIRQYIKYAEDETWQNHTNRKLPTMLIVCETKALQRQMLRLAAKELDKTYVDLKFLATTTEALVSSQSKKELIWRNASEPEESTSLDYT
ncbi:MAG TPA: replication-relaxation family protein [Candidatus Saccharimonadales bacterium]